MSEPPNKSPKRNDDSKPRDTGAPVSVPIYPINDPDDYLNIILNSIKNRNSISGTGTGRYTEKNEESSDEFDPDNYDEEVRKEINSIDDLIEIGELYQRGKRKRYNIDVKKLSKLVEPLKELKGLIGMNKIKENIVDLIVYYMQGFEKNNRLHSAISGPPGVGKTTVAQIIAKIYLKLGIIDKDVFIKADRAALIGKYLGHTAAKTKNVIESAKGGVLFIDEIYSLGNDEKRDSFSKECIDTINQCLIDNEINFICIIAGYKEEMESSFFSYNKGLERRFPFRYDIDPYTPEELRQIYLKIVKDQGWQVDSEPGLSFFEKNMPYFKFNGGDMETLFQLTKIAHSRRVFCLDKKCKRNITEADILRGFEFFLQNDKVKQRGAVNGHHSFMYL
jgi:DNA replication protein DnaC